MLLNTVLQERDELLFVDLTDLSKLHAVVNRKVDVFKKGSKIVRRRFHIEFCCESFDIRKSNAFT